ncbi:MAG: family 10 glycosylhydrolase [Candidatus Sericytochromatia bacterium]
MIKLSKKIKLVLLSSFLTLLDFNSYAFDIKDYQIISTRINSNGSFNDNYQRVNFVLAQVQEKLKQHSKLFKNSNYQQSKKDLENAKKVLDEADVAYSLGEIEKSKYLIEETLENIKSAQLNMMPSRVAEVRGLYLDADSIPKDRAEITKLIKEIKNANFNVIYPEVFRRGYTIFASTITKTDPRFKDINFDVLHYIIEEAHNNGLEVHPWIWTFRVKSPDYGDPLLSKYPDWASIKENPSPKDREALFFSPSSPQARELITKIIMEIVEGYDIDGLLMDYIRFDETNNEDILSKKYFRAYYLEKFGIEPPYRIEKKDPIFVEWQIWRENQVTEMVKNVRKRIKQTKPNVNLGVAVFRTEGEGRLLKMQDWRLWASNHYVDYICPMLYTNEAYNLDWWIDSETDKDTRNDYLYTSLGAHKFETPDDFFEQYGILTKRNITGVNIFALSHYNKKNFKDLIKGVFRNKAIIPDRNPIISIKTVLDDISNWVSNLKKTEKSLPYQQLNNMSYEINKINNSIPYDNNYKDYLALFDRLENLKYKLETYHEKGINIYFIKDVQEQISYAQRILKVYTREKIALGKVFKPSLPPLPILAETKPLPTVDIYPTNIQPKIDGEVETDLWDSVLPLRQFYWHLGSFRAEVETVVKITYGKDDLYILFENYEPNMKKIKRDIFTKDSRDILEEDSVEVYLKVAGVNQYYNFAVNMNNTQFDQRVNKSDWNGKWTSAVKVYDDKWVAEFKIPFSDIEFIPIFGESIKANFVRNRFQETDPYSHWSPTYNGPHVPSRFGTLYLK